MIAEDQCVKYNISDNDNIVGKIKVSLFIKDINSYKFPFEKTDKKSIVKIGNGNYDDFDSFIIASLNDYYQKIQNQDINKEKSIKTYTNLYSLWSNICQCKEENDVIKLNELYNKINYGLYSLGYEE